MPEEILKVKNLSFKYDDKNILNDISFTLDVGDFVGILGPNGCGKTTLLKKLIKLLGRGFVWLTSKLLTFV